MPGNVIELPAEVAAQRLADEIGELLELIERLGDADLIAAAKDRMAGLPERLWQARAVN